MNILLVIPRYSLTNKPDYDYSFPLGLGYISAVLKQNNHEVDCLNLNHLSGTTEQLLTKKLNSKKYNVVCSGHIGIGYDVIEKIIKTSKSHPSNPIVIIGGAIITTEPKLMLESLNFDFGIIGEGEVTIIELLNAIEKNKPYEKVNGIAFFKNNKVIITPPQKVIDNIDTLPYPDFEGIGFEEQLRNFSANSSPYGLFDYPRVYPIMCSRGCPFQCTFCYHCLGPRYRERSIDNVIEELELNIKKYKINIIALYDDLFSINKPRLYDFCKKIKKLLKEIPWECKWVCQLSVLNVDDDLLETIKDAGCYAVSFGFESYSPKVLKSMQKPITPELIDNALKLTLKHKLLLQGNFIFGDKAETKETAKQTLDYFKNNCKGQVALGFIQPYPGSAIYTHCINKGIIKDKLYFIKNQMRYTNWFNMTDEMTDNEILELKKQILKARRENSIYVTPRKTRKEKQDRYTLTIKCPFCKKTMKYRNHAIHDRFVYIITSSCKNCKMRFNIVSPLYKIGIKNYEKIEFFKKIYLITRDNFLKRKI